MSVVGLVLHLCYRSSRHDLGGLRLDLWGIGLCLVGGLVVLRRAGPLWGGTLLLLGVAGLAAAILSQRKGYVLFRPQPDVMLTPPASPLAADAELPLRASGTFAVRDQTRYLANHPTVYTTPRSREHILMAQLKPTRLLLLGKSREQDWGWWYQFFRPEAIVAVEPGTVIHGWRPQVGLRVRYRVQDREVRGQTVETLLGFDDSEARALGWADLTFDMAKGRATP